MAGVRTWVRGCACLVWLVIGCGREALIAGTDCDDFDSGDIVITEVHANPDGSDGVSEYIELFNASGAFLSLDGLVLETRRTDGTAPKVHRFLEASVDAGEYFVVGNSGAESLPEHLDYSYGGTLGNLRNTNGLVSISCGEMLIDQVRYESTIDGRALELDGRLAPDHVLNDDPGHWCATPDGVDEAFPGNWGTPGAANSPCAQAPLEDGCLDGESARALIAPKPGEVRITEWMANPAGPDADFEWVEALFDTAVDLNGFQLGPAPDALKPMVTQQECLPVDAGTRVVFGASPAAAPRVDAELRFSLGNSGSRSIVAGVDGILLDRVDYVGTSEGVSWQLDSDGEICPAGLEEEYLPGNFGTPSGVNAACPLTLGPGMCFDDGAPRKVLSPAPGEAEITEWMANPESVGNREGEWLELRFDAAVDLNGLVVSDLTAGSTIIEQEDCLRVGPGTYVLFARSMSSSENGGIEAVDVELSISLNNSDETLTLSVDGQVIDSVSYQRSTAGVATQVDEFGNICDAVRPYGEGDFGTPGFANPWCV